MVRRSGEEEITSLSRIFLKFYFLKKYYFFNSCSQVKPGPFGQAKPLYFFVTVKKQTLFLKCQSIFSVFLF